MCAKYLARALSHVLWGANEKLQLINLLVFYSGCNYYYSLWYYCGWVSTGAQYIVVDKNATNFLWIFNIFRTFFKGFYFNLGVRLGLFSKDKDPLKTFKKICSMLHAIKCVSVNSPHYRHIYKFPIHFLCRQFSNPYFSSVSHKEAARPSYYSRRRAPISSMAHIIW